MTAVSLSSAGRLAAAGLGFAAGFVDAYGYLRWHAFGANMTGNTVIFAVSLFGDPRHAVFCLTLIAAFVAGSFLGRVVADRFSPSLGLLIEALLLVASIFAGAYGLVVIALALGTQNTSITSFSGVAANTSFVSGDYSKLGETLAELVNSRASREDKWRTVSVLSPLLAAYALGALVAAFCTMLSYEILLVVPIVLAVAYVAHYARR
jgi:uncharacterized membrane protein YoaK (UPF0700 family)